MKRRSSLAARFSLTRALRRRGAGGSVLVIVMITLIFTALALTAFIDKAGNDLLVEARESRARNLRREAYSALEATLAVLEDFRAAGNGLHSPAEGWSDPLTWAGYVPAVEGRTIEVSFEDESGKLPLPRTAPTTLINLFMNWDLPQADAEKLTDVLMGWMTPNYNYVTAVSPTYDQGNLPYVVPARPLRSYGELAAIDYAREVFYDEGGRPNERYWRFVDNVSLFSFQQPNLNGAKPDVLAALGQFDATQQQHATEFSSGTGAYQQQGPGWFRSAADITGVLGATGNARAFGTTISALRIRLTVHDGANQFRLAATVSPSGGGATTVQTTATNTRNPTSASANQVNQQQAPAAATAQPNSAAANAATKRLNYPFTLLEILENDAIPNPPPPPPPPPS